jgi:hypothetical protein
MFRWLFNPVYFRVCELVTNSLDAQARQVLSQVSQLWVQMERGVDDLLNTALEDFVRKSFMFPINDRDSWDYGGSQHHAFCVPAATLEKLLVNRAIKTGAVVVQPSPWFTLQSVGCTPQLQQAIIQQIAAFRVKKLLKSRIGTLVGSAGPEYVLVSIRHEAYAPL